MKVRDNKKLIRERMLSERSKLTPSQKKIYDSGICQELWDLIESGKYKVVHCYLPMGSEINIFPLIELMLDSSITVVTPKTLGHRKMQHLILNSLQELEKGKFGTLHPASGMEYHGAYDIIIVPGLAFDQFKNRIGYGGGYYDNFMKDQLARKIGIFYPFQEIDLVPRDAHDVTLDEIVVDMEFEF